MRLLGNPEDRLNAQAFDVVNGGPPSSWYVLLAICVARCRGVMCSCDDFSCTTVPHADRGASSLVWIREQVAEHFYTSQPVTAIVEISCKIDWVPDLYVEDKQALQTRLRTRMVRHINQNMNTPVLF